MGEVNIFCQHIVGSIVRGELTFHAGHIYSFASVVLIYDGAHQGIPGLSVMADAHGQDEVGVDGVVW